MISIGETYNYLDSSFPKTETLETEQPIYCLPKTKKELQKVSKLREIWV